MQVDKSILDIKFEVLVEAISAIHIIDVDAKSPHEGNIALYIKTPDINTVDTNKLAEICAKYTSSKFEVTFLVPENKFITDKFIPNTDSVCIFIQENNYHKLAYHDGAN